VTTNASWTPEEGGLEPPEAEPEPCPRCAALPGRPGPAEWEGTPCPTCGRELPLPAGLPGGTVLTILLSKTLLSQTIEQVWETARSVLEDERLRTNLFTGIDPETPDALISLNKAEVPDPVTPAVLKVVEAEQAWDSVGVRRLLFALAKRRTLLATILKETYGAGFQRDEARVAARLGFRPDTVRLALQDKKLVRV
jgi:hypothetical protein